MDDFGWPDYSPWTQYCREIEKVVVSEGVTCIGAWAFEDCRVLKEVCLADSILSLGYSAFLNCSALESLYLPAGVSQFGSSCIEGCSSLASITAAPGNQTFSSSDGILYSKDGQCLYCYPEGRQDLQFVIPSEVKTVDDVAFFHNPCLQCIGIPRGITELFPFFHDDCCSLSDLYYEGSAEDWRALDHEETDLTVHYLWTYGSKMTAKPIPALSCNQDAQDYPGFSKPVCSYLIPRPDGTLIRVEALNNAVIAETYDRQKQLISRKVLAPNELPIFGGFYETDQYYFLVFGSWNEAENNSCEVIRTVRYTKDWERLDSASIYGANTHIPFSNGSLRMAQYGDYLYVLTCHEMFLYYDGLHHQGNMMYSVHIPDMRVTDIQYDIDGTGFIGHSFNQFIAIDGDRILTVNHSDALPRAMVLCEYPLKAGQELFNNGYSTDAYFLEFAGEYVDFCDSNTGASVGGFEMTGSSYMIAGNSADQTDRAYLSGQRNIFISTLPREPVEADARAELRWVTDYSRDADIDVLTPQLVRITDDRLLLLWAERRDAEKPWDARLCYQMVDGRGNALSEIYTREHAHLSDCKPVVAGDAVTWYVTDMSAPVFYSIPIDNPAALEVVETRHAYEAEKTKPTCTEQGYTTYTCRICGDSYVGNYVPALGHDWGKTTYEWSEYNSSCTAKRVCMRDETHVETAEAEVTKEQTRAPAMGERGEMTFTADFEAGWAQKQVKKEIIPALDEPVSPDIPDHPDHPDKPDKPAKPDASGKFTDISEDAWYYGAVQYAYQNGLFGGMSKNTFEPETAMSRAMLVTVLWRYEGEPAGGENIFTDVPEDEWYTVPVIWAARSKIVNGVDTGIFAPEDNITREQMAAILYRYAQGKKIDTSARAELDAFPDAWNVDSYAQAPMKWAVAEGLINGSDGELQPHGDATRAQVAAILMRFIRNVA